MLRHARRVAATRGLRRSLHLALYKIDDETVCLKLSHEQLRGKTTEELEALYAPKRERFDLAFAAGDDAGGQVAASFGATEDAAVVAETFEALWPDAADVTFHVGEPPDGRPVALDDLDLAAAAGAGDFYAKFGDVVAPVHAPVVPKRQTLPPPEAVAAAAVAVVAGYGYYGM